MTRSFATAALKYALGLGLLAWVLARNWKPSDGGPGLRDAFDKPIHLLPFAVAGLFVVLSALLTFVRWYVLVRAQDLPFTLPAALRLGATGFFFNNVLPSSLGGDLVKAVGIARGQKRRTVAVATVMVDRAIGLWGLVWLVCLLGGIFWLTGNPVLMSNPGLQTIVRSAWLVAGITTGVWALLGILPEWRAQRFARRLTRLPKIGHSAAEFWRAVWLYRARRRAIAVALALSLVSHTGNVLTFHFAAQTFITRTESDIIPSLTEHVLVVPLGMAIESLFPAPGGVGGGEYAYGRLYRLLGRPDALGVLASIARRSLTWTIGLIGYLVCLSLKPPPAASVAIDVSANEAGAAPP